MPVSTVKPGAYIVAGDSLVVVVGGVNYTISKTSALYLKVRDAVVTGDWDNAVYYLEQANSLKGEIWWNDQAGMVYYGQEPLHHSLADRLPRMLAEGFDTAPMVAFLKNLFCNPAPHAIDELYEFLERNALPITEDGCFLAYKKVREDYTDCHTGSFSNAVGQKLKMERYKCDPIRTNHCSTGFHFCGLSYLTCFGGERVMVVKINPADVTSIPNDYNFAKGRCNTYEVVDEYGGTDVQRFEAWSSSVVPGDFDDFDESLDDFYCSDCDAEDPDECSCEHDCGTDRDCDTEVPNLFTTDTAPCLDGVTNPITRSRLIHGFTAEQVAKALDMPVKVYRERIEAEGRFFKPSTIGRILHAIEVLAAEN